IIENNHRSLAPCIRADANASGVKEVSWSIEIFFGCIALSADEDYRLDAIYRQIQKIGCLLESVRTMGNNDPDNLRTGQCFHYGYLQGHPAIGVHITGR